MANVYALYDPVAKAYQVTTGYYGNECNIRCFASKEEAEQHIRAYAAHSNLKPKRMPVS